MSTIVIRGATDNIMDDIERAIDDGVNTFKALCKVCFCSLNFLLMFLFLSILIESAFPIIYTRDPTLRKIDFYEHLTGIRQVLTNYV